MTFDYQDSISGLTGIYP